MAPEEVLTRLEQLGQDASFTRGVVTGLSDGSISGTDAFELIAQNINDPVAFEDATDRLKAITQSRSRALSDRLTKENIETQNLRQQALNFDISQQPVVARKNQTDLLLALEKLEAFDPDVEKAIRAGDLENVTLRNAGLALRSKKTQIDIAIAQGTLDAQEGAAKKLEIDTAIAELNKLEKEMNFVERNIPSKVLQALTKETGLSWGGGQR